MRLKFIILSFWLLLAVVCFGEQYSDMIIEIDDIEVVGKSSQSEITPSQNLSGDELERLSSHSVADAIRYFSGTQIKDYGGTGGLKTVDVRSLGSSHVGVFYDGVQITNAQNGVVDLGRFSLDNMEAISLYSGQKSAIFQSAKDFSSASSIYLSSRVPLFEKGKNFNLKLTQSLASFTTINPSVLYEQKISDNLSLSLSTEYFYSSGEYEFTYSKTDGYDTTGVRENGDVSYFRGEATLFGDIYNGQWQAKLYFYDSERGYPGAVVRSVTDEFMNEDRQWDTNFFAQAFLRRSVSRYYDFKLSAKLSYDYLRYVTDPESVSYYDNFYRQSEGYFSLANLFTINKFISIGYSTDFQYNTLSSDASNFAFPERYTALNALSVSARYGGVSAQASVLSSYVSDHTKTDVQSDAHSEFTPTFIVNYKPFKSEDFSLRAFYKRVFRMPTFNDMYYVSVGDPELSPEYTNQYNFGFNYGFRSFLNVQVDTYFNQVQDKIVAMPTSNQFRWTMLNLGYVEIFGVDFSLEAMHKFGELTAKAKFSYTYQSAKDLTDNTSPYYGGQIPYAPWHSGSAILTFFYRGWSLNYSWMYTGERYESQANIAENYVQPWYTSDLSLTKNYKNLTLSFDVNNIFNQSYEVVQNYPMPGINFKFKFTIDL
ncbi:MAG: TonB-dependent receptor [Rikenellaceae bacterium]